MLIIHYTLFLLFFPASLKSFLFQALPLLHPISELIEKLATFLLLLHDSVYIFTDRIEAFDFTWYLVMVIRSILEDWP